VDEEEAIEEEDEELENPSKHIKKDIIYKIFGCFLVEIGHKLSKAAYIEV
jgi:hypothetical protein